MKKERDEEWEEWESKGGVEKREEREGEWEREVLFFICKLDLSSIRFFVDKMRLGALQWQNHAKWRICDTLEMSTRLCI